MEVVRSNEGISLYQRKYTLDLLTETGMLGYHPSDTPIKFNCKLVMIKFQLIKNNINAL